MRHDVGEKSEVRSQRSGRFSERSENRSQESDSSAPRGATCTLERPSAEGLPQVSPGPPRHECSRRYGRENVLPCKGSAETVQPFQGRPNITRQPRAALV